MPVEVEVYRLQRTKDVSESFHKINPGSIDNFTIDNNRRGAETRMVVACSVDNSIGTVTFFGKNLHKKLDPVFYEEGAEDLISLDPTEPIKIDSEQVLSIFLLGRRKQPTKEITIYLAPKDDDGDDGKESVPDNSPLGVAA
jgi:hypothetical protein